MKSLRRSVRLLLLVPALLGLLAAPGLAAPKADDLFQKARGLDTKSQFSQAKDLYKQARSQYLEAGDLDRANACRFAVYRIDELTYEFPYSEKQARQMVDKRFPGVPKKTRDSWFKDGSLDSFVIDGQRRYFNGFAANIFFRHPEMMKNDPDAQKQYQGFTKVYFDLIDQLAAVKDPQPTWQPFLDPLDITATGQMTIPKAKLPAAGLYQVWLGVPLKTTAQDNVKIVSISPAQYLKTVPNTDGDLGLAYLEIPLEEISGDLTISTQYTLTHYQQAFRIDPAQIGTYDKSGGLYAKYTANAGSVRFTPAMAAKAKEITGDEANPYLQAKKIYDHIVNNVFYSLMPHVNLAAQGIPESVFVFQNNFGDCGAQSMLFVAFCRSLGIPARVVCGLQLCPGFSGDHAWAEFYLPSYGWVPVDTSIGQLAGFLKDLPEDRKQAYKDFFFAHQDPYRYVIQSTIDVPFNPRPAEPPVFRQIALQEPAIICTTAEDPPGLFALDNWKVKFETSRQPVIEIK